MVLIIYVEQFTFEQFIHKETYVIKEFKVS